MKELNEITARIRELRESCGYSAEKLALELGVDPAVYTGYEENGDYPISLIFEIAEKFHVNFTELVTGEESRITTYQVVRRGKGKSSARYEGYRYKDLAYRFADKIMQPFLVTLEPDDAHAELVTHAGQEFNLVLKGQIKVVFPDREFILSEGDSIYFDPKIPHGQRCEGSTKARFLSIIAE